MALYFRQVNIYSIRSTSEKESKGKGQVPPYPPEGNKVPFPAKSKGKERKSRCVRQQAQRSFSLYPLFRHKTQKSHGWRRVGIGNSF